MKQAGILAAGKGKRLNKIFPNIPKSLIEIGGIPLIHRSLEILSKAGINQVVILVPKNDKLIERTLKQAFESKINLLFGKGTGTSTITDLFQIQAYMSNDPFFVLMGDILFLERDFLEFRTYCLKKINASIVTAVTNFVTSPDSVFVSCIGDYVSDMGRTLKNKTLVSAGIHYFSPIIFKYKQEFLLHNSKGASITTFLKFLMEKGHKIYPFFFHEVIDINRPYDYYLATKYSKYFIE